MLKSIDLIVFEAVSYTHLFATVAASWLHKETRMTPKIIMEATCEGARGAISVGVSCAIIGIIIGTVSLTGLGLTFGNLVLKVVGADQLFLGLSLIHI